MSEKVNAGYTSALAVVAITADLRTVPDSLLARADTPAERGSR